MNDWQFMMYAFKGNEAAVDFVLTIAQIAGVWDDLIDKDQAILDKAINDAFWNALVALPRNPFYRAHMDELLPVMSAGILNWMTANKIEDDPNSSRALEISHVIRYSIADVALIAATIIGGRDCAVEVGPELRLRSQRSTMLEYLMSLEKFRHKNHADVDQDAGKG